MSALSALQHNEPLRELYERIKGKEPEHETERDRCSHAQSPDIMFRAVEEGGGIRPRVRLARRGVRAGWATDNMEAEALPGAGGETEKTRVKKLSAK